MDLIILVLMLALIGFGVWAITTYIPMPPIFRTGIYVLVFVLVLLYVLRLLGANLPNVL